MTEEFEHPLNNRTNRRIPIVATEDPETSQLKSDAQIKREWEFFKEQYGLERKQDLKLKCLRLVLEVSPEIYKKGSKPYEIAKKHFDWITEGKISGLPY